MCPSFGDLIPSISGQGLHACIPPWALPRIPWTMATASCNLFSLPATTLGLALGLGLGEADGTHPTAPLLPNTPPPQPLQLQELHFLKVEVPMV